MPEHHKNNTPNQSDFPTSGLSDANTPNKLGYSFPPEWAKHEATWLSWPHKEESWPGKIETIYEPYCQFIKIVATGEKVRINVRDEAMKTSAIAHLEKTGADLSQIEFYFNESNDAWCRDHGPACDPRK
jgi:agmatine deiminase